MNFTCPGIIGLRSKGAITVPHLDRKSNEGIHIFGFSMQIKTRFLIGISVEWQSSGLVIKMKLAFLSLNLSTIYCVLPIQPENWDVWRRSGIWPHFGVWIAILIRNQQLSEYTHGEELYAFEATCTTSSLSLTLLQA